MDINTLGMQTMVISVYKEYVVVPFEGAVQLNSQSMLGTIYVRIKALATKIRYF